MCYVFFFKQKTEYEMLRSHVGSEMCIRDGLIVAADRTLLALVKVLVTPGEAYVDELHVAPAGRRQLLSYHLLANLSRLELPDNLQVRLHVEIGTEYAVKTYIGACLLYTTDAADE